MTLNVCAIFSNVRSNKDIGVGTSVASGLYNRNKSEEQSYYQQKTGYKINNSIHGYLEANFVQSATIVSFSLLIESKYSLAS